MKKIHRFIGHYQLGLGTVRIDDARLAKQLRQVLKLKAGETIIVGDGTGVEAQCRILGYETGAVLLDCVSMGRNGIELPGQTTLYCAILKADHFELVVQKATEVGVTHIIPLITAHTVKMGIRRERLEAIAREASEQSGRGMVPQIGQAIALDQALSQARDNDVNFFFDASGKSFARPPAHTRRASLFIGPEGGWEEGEVESARRVGMEVVSLGAPILRAETAAVVASYLVAHSLKT